MATEVQDKAAVLFEDGWNCAESAFKALAEGQDGAQEWTRAAAAFGAGVAWEGHVCGALTGCAMAVGMRLGRRDPEDEVSKMRSYRIVQDLFRGVEARYGTVQCRALTGLDFHKLDDRMRYAEHVHGDVCIPLLKLAVETTARALKEEER